MSVSEPEYPPSIFKAYLIHYFYNSKTRCDRKNGFRFRISIEKYTNNTYKKYIYFKELY